MSDSPSPPRCSWCGVDHTEAAARHEGAHLTWCVHYRNEQMDDDGQPDEAQEWHDFDPEC